MDWLPGVSRVTVMTMAMILLVKFCRGFVYLPTSPVSYCKPGTGKSLEESKETCKTEMVVHVNTLNSLETLLPYEYNRFDFCPTYGISSPVETMSQVVLGDRIHLSSYKLEFGKAATCQEVCHKTYSTHNKESVSKLNFLKKGILLDYQHHWVIDNMPVTWCYNVEGGEKFCSTGFPIGCYVDYKGVRKDACVISPKYSGKDRYYIFNHLDITIWYNTVDGKDSVSQEKNDQSGRLISAHIEPQSYRPGPDNKARCRGEPLYMTNNDSTLDIFYTYSVSFKVNNDIKWHSRWDYILESMQHNIQWFSIFNTFVIVLFLSCLMAYVLLKTLRRDLACCNTAQDKKGRGWTLVHKDVFRPPSNGMMLAVLVGNGVQIFLMALITLVFGSFGFFSPANRGALLTCLLVVYVLLGSPAGYVSARIYKRFGGEKLKLNAVLTAMLFPGVIFGIFFVLNLIQWAEQSSAAVPFTMLLALLALWFGVSVPLTMAGAYCGFKRTTKSPACADEIPRPIPKQPIFKRALFCNLFGGILPFGCIFIQLFFILNSIWSNQVYYMFGFLILVFVLLVVICSECSILLCYFQLCSENYHWWWRSYLNSASSAVYFFIYCIHYYVTKLEMKGVASAFLYFGYTMMMVLLFSLLTGSIGFAACFWFVSKIYSSFSNLNLEKQWTKDGGLPLTSTIGYEADVDSTGPQKVPGELPLSPTVFTSVSEESNMRDKGSKLVSSKCLKSSGAGF